MRDPQRPSELSYEPQTIQRRFIPGAGVRLRCQLTAQPDSHGFQFDVYVHVYNMYYIEIEYSLRSSMPFSMLDLTAVIVVLRCRAMTSTGSFSRNLSTSRVQ